MTIRHRKPAVQHTPTPWARAPSTHRGRFTFGENDIQARNPDGYGVFHVVHWSGFDSADGTKTQKKANAAFIVTAVNAYERNQDTIRMLVEALEILLELDEHSSDEWVAQANKRAKEAIKHAKE